MTLVNREDLEELWSAVEAERNNMDAGEYKHVVLGLVFLRYISLAFEELRARLETEKALGADPDDRDEYVAENVFWIPESARWSAILGKARQADIGVLLDEAMLVTESENASLKGVLPKEYGRPALDKQRLGTLIAFIGDIGLGSAVEEAKGILGIAYEDFLTRFALAEGKNGDQSYTPRSVVRLLVELLAPRRGRLYDPACGSGGMFVYGEQFVMDKHGSLGDLSLYGQEINHTTWRLAKMNLAIRGIDAKIEHGDSFHEDKHRDLKADFILFNPPFNDGTWRGDLLRDDARWRYGMPPPSNANFAWMQHAIAHLAPDGMAGIVLANGSMSSAQSGEGEIRRKIIEDDLVDCMVALPGQLFSSTQIPVCLWILARNKNDGMLRDRRGQTLFIDARKMGYLVDRVHRLLKEEEITEVARVYHAWRGDRDAGEYMDKAGSCKSATMEDIQKHECVLTPGRYIDAEAAEDEGEPFDEKIKKLVTVLGEQQSDMMQQDELIGQALKQIGYGE